MLSAIIALLGILITILFVIGTHEAAHFAIARLLGVKVLRFSIGFGKKLISWQDKSGTEYVFALIPLGGYVKMLDENEGEVPPNELHLAYNRQPIYKKFLIVLAGPAMNILCALVLYWLVFVIGFVTVKPIIGTIKPQSIAAKAHMQGQQEILSVDNVQTHTWTSALFRVLAHAGNQDQLTLETKNLTTQKVQSYVLDLSNWHLNELTPDPLTSLGLIPYEPSIPLVIGVIGENSPASRSTLQIGDRIIAINGIHYRNWDEVITYIISHPQALVTFTVERNHKTETFPITLGYKQNIFFQKTGYLGIAPQFSTPKEMLNTMQYAPLPAVVRAWQEVRDFTYFNFLLFGKMFTGKLSLQSLGGPITIFESAGEALNYGFVSFIGFLAFLSLSVGLINLLPIPGLDGGHLFMQIIEAIIRRPVPEKIQLALFRLGFIFILFILIQALVNDLLRIGW